MEGETRRLSALAISLALFGVISSLTSCARPAPAKTASEVVEIPGSAFTVRISAFPEENGGFVPGVARRQPYDSLIAQLALAADPP